VRFAENTDATVRAITQLRSDGEIHVLAERGPEPHQGLAAKFESRPLSGAEQRRRPSSTRDFGARRGDRRTDTATMRERNSGLLPRPHGSGARAARALNRGREHLSRLAIDNRPALRGCIRTAAFQ